LRRWRGQRHLDLSIPQQWITFKCKVAATSDQLNSAIQHIREETLVKLVAEIKKAEVESRDKKEGEGKINVNELEPIPISLKCTTYKFEEKTNERSKVRSWVKTDLGYSYKAGCPACVKATRSRDVCEYHLQLHFGWRPWTFTSLILADGEHS